MDTEPIETCTYKGHTITLRFDPDPLNPREENDNLGRMVCWHRHYDLGDTHPFDSPEQFDECLALVQSGRDDIHLDAIDCPESFLEEQCNEPTPVDPVEEFVNQLDPGGATKVVILPLYLYEHSGITLRAGAFGERWNSGRIGYIYVDRATILKEYGGRRLTPALERQARQRLEAEVQTYATYLEDNIVGYEIAKKGKLLHSCWGFDDHEYALREARSAVDCLISQCLRAKQRAA